jgi:transcriptional regulator with XRE-family HTH domain
MLASDMVRTALAGAGKTQKELAEYMGWTPQNVSARLKNNSLTFDELAKALSFTGYEVSMKTASGAELPIADTNSSPRVAQMVGGAVYDTARAASICTNKSTMLEDFYVELFRDAEGSYFVVLYELWENGCSRIAPITDETAQKFRALCAATR